MFNVTKAIFLYQMQCQTTVTCMEGRMPSYYLTRFDYNVTEDSKQISKCIKKKIEVNFYSIVMQEHGRLIQRNDKS